jgi:hypothetical protein
MPYHVSLVLTVNEGDIKKWVKKFKAYITRNSDLKKLWKKGFEFEEVDNSLVSYKCEEVVKQPEKIGIVDYWHEYGLSFRV